MSNKGFVSAVMAKINRGNYDLSRIPKQWRGRFPEDDADDLTIAQGGGMSSVKRAAMRRRRRRSTIIGGGA